MHPLSDLSGRVIGHAIEVHKQLGPGLSEAAYERALSLEFSAAGVEFVRQLAIPITYRGEVVGVYRPDFVVEDLVVLEIKSVDRLTPVHKAQMLTYLRVTRRELGLVINFNVTALYLGVERVVLRTGGTTI